jgi:hypothetical protein
MTGGAAARAATDESPAPPESYRAWCWTGDVVVPGAQETMSFSVDSASAPTLQALTSGCGALVAGHGSEVDLDVIRAW